LTITFTTLLISHAPYFFMKMFMWFLDYRIRNVYSLCFVVGWGGKSEFFINSDFIIRTPQKIGCVLWFFRIIKSEHPLNTLFLGEKQFGLYNPNCISTNYEHVCNMDNQFKDHINLHNFHPSILGHCYLFPVKNSIFWLFDQIALKLSHKIINLKIPPFRPILKFFILRKIWKNLH